MADYSQPLSPSYTLVTSKSLRSTNHNIYHQNALCIRVLFYIAVNIQHFPQQTKISVRACVVELESRRADLICACADARIRNVASAMLRLARPSFLSQPMVVAGGDRRRGRVQIAQHFPKHSGFSSKRHSLKQSSSWSDRISTYSSRQCTSLRPC